MSRRYHARLDTWWLLSFHNVKTIVKIIKHWINVTFFLVALAAFRQLVATNSQWQKWLEWVFATDSKTHRLIDSQTDYSQASCSQARPHCVCTALDAMRCEGLRNEIVVKKKKNTESKPHRFHRVGVSKVKSDDDDDVIVRFLRAPFPL